MKELEKKKTDGTKQRGCRRKLHMQKTRENGKNGSSAKPYFTPMVWRMKRMIADRTEPWFNKHNVR